MEELHWFGGHHQILLSFKRKCICILARDAAIKRKIQIVIKTINFFLVDGFYNYLRRSDLHLSISSTAIQAGQSQYLLPFVLISFA